MIECNKRLGHTGGHSYSPHRHTLACGAELTIGEAYAAYEAIEIAKWIKRGTALADNSSVPPIRPMRPTPPEPEQPERPKTAKQIAAETLAKVDVTVEEAIAVIALTVVASKSSREAAAEMLTRITDKIMEGIEEGEADE